MRSSPHSTTMDEKEGEAIDSRREAFVHRLMSFVVSGMLLVEAGAMELYSRKVLLMLEEAHTLTTVQRIALGRPLELLAVGVALALLAVSFTFQPRTFAQGLVGPCIGGVLVLAAPVIYVAALTSAI